MLAQPTRESEKVTEKGRQASKGAINVANVACTTKARQSMLELGTSGMLTGLSMTECNPVKEVTVKHMQNMEHILDGICALPEVL
ncbi:hypothetical protein GGI05_005491, partial [Coemansia sp. RSA 2603]